MKIKKRFNQKDAIDTSVLSQDSEIDGQINLHLFDFAKDTGITIVTRCLVFFFSLLTSVIIARILGPEGKGIYALVILLPTFITKFTNFGIGPATIYNIGQKKFPDSEILGNNILLSAVLGIFSFIIGIIVIVFFHNTFFSGVDKSYLFWALFLAPLAIFNVNVLFIFLGKQYIKQYNFMNFINTFLLFLLIFLALIILRLHVLGIIIATIVAFILANVFLFWRMRKSISSTSFNLNGAYLKSTFGFGIPSNVGIILNHLNYRFDLLLVNVFLNPVAVGLYSIAAGMAEQSWLISQAAGTVLFPRISSENSEHVRKELTPIISRNVFIITTLLAVLLFFLSPWLIRFLFSEQFLPSVKPLKILLPGIIALSVWRLLYNDIAGRGKPVLNTCVNSVSLIINIILNIFWIPKYGIEGAAWATTVSYSVALCGTAMIYHKLTNISFSEIFLLQHSDILLYKRFFVYLFNKAK